MADKENLFYTIITLRLNSLWGTQVEKSWNTEAACSRCWLLVGIVCTYQWNFLLAFHAHFQLPTLGEVLEIQWAWPCFLDL